MFPFAKHPGQRNPLKRLLSLAGYYLVPALLRLRNIRAGANGELIDNDELPYYIAASDVIFVQRKRILNSGNVPLAFLFRKVVASRTTGMWANCCARPETRFSLPTTTPASYVRWNRPDGWRNRAREKRTTATPGSI